MCPPFFRASVPVGMESQPGDAGGATRIVIEVANNRDRGHSAAG
jgi:hypothetical protein